MGDPQLARNRSGRLTAMPGRPTTPPLPASRRAVLAGTAALLLAARPAAARPLDEVTARGRLRVAVYRDFPPFSYRRDGELAGIDTELARLLARKLGVGIEILEHTAGETVSDDLRIAVWKGSVLGGEPADVMMHVPYDREFGRRNAEAVLFAPYQRERFAIARNPERLPAGPLSALPENLADGERIGVEIDTVPDVFLLGAFGGRLRDRAAHFPTVTGAVAALTAGDVAAVLAPLSALEAALGATRGAFPVQASGLPGLPGDGWDIGMAVKENARDLAYALTDIVGELEADGSLAALFARHGVTHSPAEANQ